MIYILFCIIEYMHDTLADVNSSQCSLHISGIVVLPLHLGKSKGKDLVSSGS